MNGIAGPVRRHEDRPRGQLRGELVGKDLAHAAALTPIRDVIAGVRAMPDKKVGGLDVALPDGGNPAVVAPSALAKGVPAPFSQEPSAAGGARMHPQFVVIDFDKPSARVYVGSYNFSAAADRRTGRTCS